MPLVMGNVGRSINASGTWVGYRERCPPNFGLTTAVMGSFGDSPIELPFPSGENTARAHGINNAGVVVGFTWTCAQTATIWLPDSIIMLPPLPGGIGSIAYAVNNSLQVVGSRDLGNRRVGFIWQAGTFVDFDPGADTQCEVRDIANSGLTTGDVGSLVRGGSAFRWDGHHVDWLPPFRGGTASNGLAINDAGVVVGFTFGPVPFWGSASRATVWQSNVGQALAEFSLYKNSFARGINNRSVIIGYAVHPTNPRTMQSQVGMLWIHGEAIPLQGLVDDQFGFICADAIDINELGQILALCSNDVVGGLCILTPVAPPPQDLTGDCAVDADDLGVLLTKWGTRSPDADFNQDGVVDGGDLAVMLGAWTRGE